MLVVRCNSFFKPLLIIKCLIVSSKCTISREAEKSLQGDTTVLLTWQKFVPKLRRHPVLCPCSSSGSTPQKTPSGCFDSKRTMTLLLIWVFLSHELHVVLRYETHLAVEAALQPAGLQRRADWNWGESALARGIPDLGCSLPNLNFPLKKKFFYNTIHSHTVSRSLRFCEMFWNWKCGGT